MNTDCFVNNYCFPLFITLSLFIDILPITNAVECVSFYLLTLFSPILILYKGHNELNISELRHPKENLYRTICMLTGGMIWLMLLLGSLFSIMIFLIPLAVFLFFMEKFFQARIYGNAVHVNEQQYTEINAIAVEMAATLNVTKRPEMFIFNSQGMTNALAVKFLSGKYVLLFSDLVDLLWEENDRKNKLRFVIAHEIAHHAAGHTSLWLNLLIKPALFTPFLGAAYSRSCELTSDRIAAYLVNNDESSIDALIALTVGSKELLKETNKEAFIQQEERIPSVFGFLCEILSTHPRMTQRVLAIKNVNQPLNAPNMSSSIG